MGYRLNGNGYTNLGRVFTTPRVTPQPLNIVLHADVRWTDTLTEYRARGVKSTGGVENVWSFGLPAVCFGFWVLTHTSHVTDYRPGDWSRVVRLHGAHVTNHAEADG